MNKIIIGILVLAALFVLYFLRTGGGKPGAPLSFPAPSGVAPAKPAIEAVKAKKRVRVQSVPKEEPGLAKAAGVNEKQEKRRKKRFSRLREPGEAMGGGVQLDLSDNTTGPAQQKK